MTRVVMVPLQTNPYQRILADALRTQGVDVRLGKGPRRHAISPLLGAWLHAGMPRVLHLHWTGRYLDPVLGRPRLAARRTLLELQLLRLLRVRLVWTLHNIGDHEGPKGQREMLFHQRLVSLTDAVICHCSAALDLAIEAYHLPAGLRDRLHVVEHGNYAGVYPDTVDRATARARLGVDPTARVFLFLGQVRRYKGVEELITTFRALDAPEARLIVAGQPRADTCAAVIQEAAGDDRITLALGLIPDDEMQLYLRAADALVLPYRDVLTSGSAILGMTFGLPVIGPAIGCLPGTLEGSGILYDADDPQGLAGALQAARTADLGMLGRHAAARAATLDWASIAAQTALLYTGHTTS